MDKITERHLSRSAYVYVRQSTQYQVDHNQESSRRQYALVDKARRLGWKEIQVVDEDMGCSGSGSVRRAGFERVVAAVGMGGVGAVLSVEASRLARNNRDWHHLVGLCGMVGTLIIDEDGIYDASTVNDRLLLGLKGTMSEYELALLQQRARAALRQKAKRGELYLIQPVGYVITPDSGCEKDPDLRVQSALQCLFTKFAQLGSARRVLVWFQQAHVEFPHIESSSVGGQVHWRVPSYTTIHNILIHPVYAGAYVFGRTQTRIIVRDGRVEKKRTNRLPMEQWEVLIKEHHEGYITWEQYEQNRRQLADNCTMIPETRGHGAAREGATLLAGLLRCSRCGRRIRVAYSGAKAQICRYHCLGAHQNHAGPRCISFAGRAVDEALQQQILLALQPAALEASVRAAEQLRMAGEEKRTAAALAVEQAQYEADRAFRQYNAVDPDNRLVAAQLEKRWERAIEKVKQREGTLAQIAADRQPFTDHDYNELLRFGQQLPAIWRDQNCDMRLKKMIVRTLIEEIIADVDSGAGQVVLTVHWKGGTHSVLRVKRARVGHSRIRTDKDTISIVREMALLMPDRDIATTLNRLGRKTVHGKSWTRQLVNSLRKGHTIPVYDPQERRRQGIITMDEAATQLGLYPMSVRRMIDKGIIKSRQIAPRVPHIIYRHQLETEPVRGEIERIRRGLRSPLTTDPNQTWLKLQ
jgi:DNA invertase Pin-like site-specific DNA recombinase